MKLTVQQIDLKRALFSILFALPSKTTMQVLQMVRIDTDENILTLCATDLKTTIVTSIQARVERQGRILLEGKMLYDLVNNFPNKQIEIETTDFHDACNVVCGNSRNTLYMQDYENYPNIDDVCTNDGLIAEFKPDTWKQGLQQIAVAAANDDNRPILAGIQFSIIDDSKDKLNLIATDGYRMAYKSETFKMLAIPAKKSFVIPINVIETTMKLIQSNTENVELFINENAIGFRITSIDIETKIMGRQIDGQYPNVINLIPQSFDTTVCVSRDELQKSLRVAKLFSTKTVNVVDITVDADKISFFARGQDKGKSDNQLDAIVNGLQMSISVNINFLEESINAMTTSQVIIRANNAMKPLVIGEFHDNETKSDVMHVIMPIQKK